MRIPRLVCLIALLQAGGGVSLRLAPKLHISPEDLAQGISRNEQDHRRECDDRTYYVGEVPPYELDVNCTSYKIRENLLSPGNAPFGSDPCIHMTEPVFSAAECQAVIDEVEAAWDTEGLASSFTYQINAEAHVKDLPKTLSWFNASLRDTIFPLIGHLFPSAVTNASSLRVYDALVIKYNATETPGACQPIHRDASLVSFNIPLNSFSTCFTGGGTWIEALNQSLRGETGAILAHASTLRHSGHAIQSGVRYILVAFLMTEDLQRMENTRKFKAAGIKLKGEGKWEQAEHQWLSGLAINHLDHDLYFYLGTAQAERGNDLKAEELYKESLELNPSDAKVLNNLGMLLMQKRPCEAAEHFQRALECDPTNIAAMLNGGLMLTKQGRWEDAVKMLSKIEDLPPPPNEDPHRASVRRQISQLLEYSRRQMLAGP